MDLARVVPMCTRRMLPERRELDLIRVASRERHGVGEGLLEEPRRVARQHDPLQILAADIRRKDLRVELGRDRRGP